MKDCGKERGGVKTVPCFSAAEVPTGAQSSGLAFDLCLGWPSFCLAGGLT